MIHWTDIEKSKEGIFRILEVIKNYEKDGEVRFIEGIQRRHFSEGWKPCFQWVERLLPKSGKDASDG